jgi:tetratricopeptide (TPR) repeat protein
LLHFGRDTGRRSAENATQPWAADPSLLQLLPLMALRAEAASSGLAAHRAEGSAQVHAFIRHALVLRETARRTGEAETLARAASAALRAEALAKNDRKAKALALISHAQALYVGAALFGDDEAARIATDRLDEAAKLPLDPVAQARLDALRAGLLARQALFARSPMVCKAAGAALSAAAKALDALAKLGKLDDSEVHEARCDRADLLIGAGLRAKDRGKLELALSELQTLAPALDPAYRPLTWARAETLRGQALAALGDMAGEAAAIAEGSIVLTTVVEELPASHSPLDVARAGHALGLVLQSLGEACEEEALFDRAIAAFAPALAALDEAHLLPLRSVVAHDGAACLARRAERRGDLASLERAEAAFRDALKTRSAAADPLSWAVTQVALARIYEAEAELRGDTGERADAAFALASALEIFAEKGLRSLSDVALTALERVKAVA